MLFSSIYAEEPAESLGLDGYVNVMDEHIRKSQLRRCFQCQRYNAGLIAREGYTIY